MGVPVVLLLMLLAASAVLCSTAVAASSAAVLPLAWGDDSGGRRLQTAVNLGTPPQTVPLDVDISAEVSYIPCLLRQLNFEGDQRRVFRPANSSTYSPLSCNTLSCQSDPQCSHSCALFSNSIVDPQPNLQPFTETISTFSSSSFDMLLACKPARLLGSGSGVLALGAGELGVGAQGVREGVIEGGELSLCVGLEKGVAVVGKDWTIPKEVVEGMAHTRLVDITQSPGSYAMQVSEISISYNDSDDDDDDEDTNNDDDDSNNSDDEDNVHAARHTYIAVLSTMPEGLRLPSPAYSFVLDKIRKVVEKVGGFSPVDGGAASHVMEVCYAALNTRSWRKLPTIVLGFVGDDEAALTVPPRNYLYAHPARANARCVGVFNNGVQGIRIGVELLRGVFVRIDMDNSEVGFARTNCTRVAANVIGDAAVYNFTTADVNATAPAYDSLPAPAPGPDALNDTLLNMTQDNYTTFPTPASALVLAPEPAPEPALGPESLPPLTGDMLPAELPPASAPAPGPPEQEAESGGIAATHGLAPPPMSAMDAVQKQAAKLAEQTQSPAFKWVLVALCVLLAAWGVRSCCLRLRASFRRRHYKRVEDITKSIEL